MDLVFVAQWVESQLSRLEIVCLNAKAAYKNAAHYSYMRVLHAYGTHFTCDAPQFKRIAHVIWFASDGY